MWSSCRTVLRKTTSATSIVVLSTLPVPRTSPPFPIHARSPYGEPLADFAGGDWFSRGFGLGCNNDATNTIRQKTLGGERLHAARNHDRYCGHDGWAARCDGEFCHSNR